MIPRRRRTGLFLWPSRAPFRRATVSPRPAPVPDPYAARECRSAPSSAARATPRDRLPFPLRSGKSRVKGKTAASGSGMIACARGTTALGRGQPASSASPTFVRAAGIAPPLTVPTVLWTHAPSGAACSLGSTTATVPQRPSFGSCARSALARTPRCLNTNKAISSLLGRAGAQACALDGPAGVPRWWPFDHGCLTPGRRLAGEHCRAARSTEYAYSCRPAPRQGPWAVSAY